MNHPMPMPYGYFNSNGQSNNYQMPNNLNNENNSSLQYQINELKQRIRILEQRIEAIESQNPQANSTPYHSSMYMV